MRPVPVDSGYVGELFPCANDEVKNEICWIFEKVCPQTGNCKARVSVSLAGKILGAAHPSLCPEGIGRLNRSEETVVRVTDRFANGC
jgi:hypothetical protein